MPRLTCLRCTPSSPLILQSSQKVLGIISAKGRMLACVSSLENAFDSSLNPKMLSAFATLQLCRPELTFLPLITASLRYTERISMYSTIQDLCFSGDCSYDARPSQCWLGAWHREFQRILWEPCVPNRWLEGVPYLSNQGNRFVWAVESWPLQELRASAADRSCSTYPGLGSALGELNLMNLAKYLKETWLRNRKITLLDYRPISSLPGRRWIKYCCIPYTPHVQYSHIRKWSSSNVSR